MEMSGEILAAVRAPWFLPLPRTKFLPVMVRTSPTLASRGVTFLMTGALASAFFFFEDFFVDFAATTAPPGWSGGLAAAAVEGSANRTEAARASDSRRVIAAFIGC